MYAFVGGMITMGFIIAGLFFLRFWYRTGDGLFLVFAFAFWLLALHKALVSLVAGATESNPWAFVPTLAAFALLIFAILAKNFDGSRK